MELCRFLTLFDRFEHFASRIPADFGNLNLLLFTLIDGVYILNFSNGLILKILSILDLLV